MATGDRLQIADKPTLDNVNKNLGETADAGGSMTTGTSMAKLNEDIRLSSATLQEVQNLGVTMNGEASPYGTGLLGDVTFNSANFTWPTQDFYNRYIIQVKSLTIPEGQTMKPPAKCDGLYILSQGDVNINGNIDIRGLRKTFGDVKISPTINVGTRTFELAKGGYAPKGGANGEGGKSTGDYRPSVNGQSPSLEPKNSISGNVNGGGVGQYGLAGISEWYDRQDSKFKPYTQFGSMHSVNKELPEIRRDSQLVYGNTAPTAIVIIAKGKIIINGNILASASDGVEPKDAMDYGVCYHYSLSGWGFTFAGDGAIPPSGGGAVTLICKLLRCNGKIDTNGKKFITPNKPDKRNIKPTKMYRVGVDTDMQWDDSYNYMYLGQGGFGGTFVSTAGQIKVYEGVDE